MPNPFSMTARILQSVEGLSFYRIKKTSNQKIDALIK